MAVWLFTLIVPAVMIISGACFKKSSPKDINLLFGYRTALSIKNRETWDLAHRLIGGYWFYAGIALLPVTAALALMLTESEAALLAVLYSQPALLISGVVYTEIKLRRTFDKYGNRR